MHSRGACRVAVGAAFLGLLGFGTAPSARAAEGGEPAGSLKVRVSAPDLASTVEAAGGTLVADYGGFSVWRLPPLQARSLARRSPRIEVLEDENRILVNTGALDTTTDEAKALSGAAVSFEARRLHLVQFAGPVLPGWYESLVATGVKVVQAIPRNAYLVWGDAGALAALQSLAGSSPFVQWEGPYAAEYKIQPGALAAKGRQADPDATGFFQVQLVQDAAANADTWRFVDSVRTGEVRQRTEALGYVNFVVAMAAASVAALAEQPDVVSIASWVEPRKRDERQDIILTGNVSGSPAVPTPMDYLAYLAGKGFDTSTTASFTVNLSDSGVDDATTTPNHFALYRVGDSSVPANSRVVYNRLLGTPNGGSTLQGCDGHGNENAHIIAGYVPTGTVGGVNFDAFPHADASAFRWDLGVAPFVKVGSSVIFDPVSFTFPVFQDIESQAYQDSARISNNSWGANTNAYTVDSQQYDALVRDAQPDTGCAPPCVSVPGNQEMVILFSAGNAGPGAGTVGSPGTAKNVVTVGAAEGVSPFGGSDGCGIADTGADNANDIIGFSSRGPTADGRRKPDIVGPGTHVSGGVAQASVVVPPGSGTGAQLACFNAIGVCGGTGGSNFFPGGQEYYTASSGTSHSTPALSGAAALIRQHFLNQALAPPSPAMTKALILNSARYLDGAGANDTLPSNSQGMGELSLERYFDVFATGHSLHDQVPAETFTASGQQRVFTGFVSDGARPVRITLAWTDTPGPTSGNAFVNDLDLEVSVGGNAYKGNVFSGAFSTTGSSADTRNNVESVFVPAGVSGNLVIRVSASNIAGDGVPNNAQPLDQDFALVAYNVTEGPLPVVTDGTSTITAESCGTGNGAIDPAETVTVELGLRNIGTAPTTSLVATLLAGGGVTAPSGPQNYGSLAPAGPEVARPFTFTAGTNCGDTLTATLQLQDGASNLGTVTFSFPTGALGAPVTATYSTGNVAVPIPDVGSVDVPIAISDTGVVTDVNVRVRLNHTFDGDLQISLVSPSGTTIPLVTNRGGGGDNFGTGTNDCSGTPTVLDDSAATPIGSGTAPFAGSFMPEEPLSGLNGLFANGTWTIHAADTAALDTGTIGCLQLEITRRNFVCCGAGTPQIVAAGAPTLTAESFLPPNNAPDPGEVVTATFPLINIGTADTTDLVATMQSSASVTPLTPTQDYGVVPATGNPVSRPFTFIPHGVCGTTFDATLDLQDGTLDLGSLSYTFQFGSTSSSSITFSNPSQVIIPGSGSGASTGAPSNPYPSNITVSGVSGTVSKVTVGIHGFSHTFPDDVDVLLVGPTGRKMLVLSDVGGTNDPPNVDITLDDDAVATLPDSGVISSGAFKPANFGTVQDPFPAPAPAAPYLSPAPGGVDTLASAFAGQNPNGTWSLYVVDDAATDVGAFGGGWSLTLTTVAPPTCSTPALVVFDELVHDSRQTRSLGPAAAPAEHHYRILQRPRSSYEVVVDAVTGDLGPNGPDLDRVAPDGSTVVQGSLPATNGSSRSLRWQTGPNGLVADQFIRVRSAGCTANCDAADTFRVRAYETTYRFPRYNNSASQITVVVISNPTDRPVNGTLWFYQGSAGTPVAEVPVQMQPKGSFVLNTSSIPALAGAGSFSFGNDAPFGALIGKAVAVEPNTGFTFDTAMVPRPASTKMVPRDN